MHVLVDGAPLLQPAAGIGRYTREVLRVALTRGGNHYTLFGVRARPPAPPLNHRDVDIRYARMPSQLYSASLRNVGTAPPIDVLTRVRADVAFFPNYTTFPLRRRIPTVTVVHDLSFMHFPDMFTRRARRYLQRAVAHTVQRADVVVSDSEFVKAEIIDRYTVDPARVRAIPLGVDHTMFSPAAAGGVTGMCARLGITPSYVLHVGTMEPRKNLVGLLAGYRSLPAELKQRHPLVIAGGGGWRDKHVMARLEEARAAGESIHTIGYVRDADLPALYAGAVVFAFPSFYEGFGLPVVEAMATGTPVITSRHASLAEAAAEAAVLADPRDDADIAHALRRVLDDAALRNTLVERGIAQAGRYSWDTTTDALLELFAEVSR